MPFKTSAAILALVAAGSSVKLARADSFWVEQGPGPIYNGSNVAVPPNSPEAGAVSGIVPVSTNNGVIYVATVNGGIWRTFDADIAMPHWTPLTDNALPALSIASLAASPLGNEVMFAGTGSRSSLANAGSTGFGIARTFDGGAKWSIIGQSTFTGRRVTSVLPTKLKRGAVLLAATRPNYGDDIKDPDIAVVDVKQNAAVPAAAKFYGLFRSGNSLDRDPASVVFTQISNAAGSGLPAGGVGAIAADPIHPNRFYASISAKEGGAAQAGVYFSNDGGLTWKRVIGSGTTGISGLETSERVMLAVHGDTNVVAVYAAVIDKSGGLSGTFRSINQGATWKAMGVPSPAIFPGGQGRLHGALLADPKNPNIVYISGDRQDFPFPNANGCQTYGGAIFRGNASATRAQQWHNLTCDDAQGTVPHADSRALAIGADGSLLEGDDGGLYKLTGPAGSSPKWTALVGDLRPTEFHSIAYDPFSRVIFGGAQDNGTAVQTRPGSFSWNEFVGGDGGVVAVDADQRAHPGKSLRYTAYTGLQIFTRSSWDANNNFLGVEPVRLRIVAGSTCKGTLAQCDATAPFYTPMTLNTINPRRMLIGTTSLYESTTGGDSLTKLADLGDAVGGSSLFGQPMVYGGKLNGKSNVGMFYAGSGARVFHRANAGSPVVRLAGYQGDDVQTIAVNPYNYQQVFALDVHSHLWGSLDEGAHWVSIVSNLHQLTAKVGTIAVYAPDSIASHVVVIAGGFGAFQIHIGSIGAKWTALGAGFPHALVSDLKYDQASDKLIAGTLGRGAWTMTGFFSGTSPATADVSAARENQAPPKPFGYRPPPMPSVTAPTPAHW